MSKPKYETLDQLIAAITKYLQNESKPTPAHFRAIGLGLTRQNVNTYRTSNPEYFYSIKNAEELIIAIMEQKFAYGGKEMYNLYKIMKRFDKSYREETYQLQGAAELVEGTKEQQQMIQFVLPKANAKKGVQSVRKPKLISKK